MTFLCNLRYFSSVQQMIFSFSCPTFCGKRWRKTSQRMLPDGINKRQNCKNNAFLPLPHSSARWWKVIKCADLGGGLEGRAPPAQNFSIFMQFLGEIGQILGWRPPLVVSVPSTGKSWIRHWLFTLSIYS